MKAAIAKSLVTALHRETDRLRRGRKTQEDFSRLAKFLEAYRDRVRDFLGGFQTKERAGIEDLLWPPVCSYVKIIFELWNEAYKAGIINATLAYDIGMLGNSLLFVSSLSMRVV